jgi:hypothetical protein
MLEVTKNVGLLAVLLGVSMMLIDEAITEVIAKERVKGAN